MENYSDLCAKIEETLETLIAKCDATNKLAMLSYLLYHAKIEAQDRKMDAQ